MEQCFGQCCGTGTKTAGIATFALAEPECITVPVPKPDLDPDLTYVRNEKVKESKLRATFLVNNAASDIEKARFCTNLLLEIGAKYLMFGSGTVPGTGTKTLNLNRNKAFRFHKTDFGR